MAQWVKPRPEKPDKFGSPKSTKVGQSSSSICHHTEPLLGQRKWTLEITRSPQASQLSVCSGEQEVSCLKQGGRWGLTPRVILWPANILRKECMHTHAHIPKLFYCGMYVCACVYAYISIHTYVYGGIYHFNLFNVQFSGSKSCWLIKDIPSGLCFGIISATVGSWHILGCSLQMYKNATDLAINLLSCISDELA